MNEYREFVLEEVFRSDYGIKPQVFTQYETNSDGTFKIIKKRFVYKDREWMLTEIYNGNSNMTDYCTLTGTEEKFKRWVDAEKKLVELMRDGKG